ncbi:MAG TPA: hypothetical protein VEZ42_21295 [Pseudonocardia sp.]|nr:hypothetical protein [Pseudonocardia sp.]
MPPEILVTSHVHTDGPIPGPHSLLTLTSLGHLPGGGVTDPITINLRELPGAKLHPVSLQSWRRRPEDWLSTRRATRAPAVAMATYTDWVDRLPGDPVFVADTAEPDYLFLYWYLQRFTGRWPFTATLADADLHDRLGASSSCPLAGCRMPAPLARIS